jgi:hypothetical protein
MAATISGHLRHAGAAPGLSLALALAGCSAGDMDSFGPGALSISGAADDTGGEPAETDGEDGIGKTGPQPNGEDDGSDAGSDDAGIGTWGAQTTSAGSTGAPEGEAESDGAAAESDGGDPVEPEPEPEPEPGFPMWENCTQNGDCEDGVCLIAEDEQGAQYGAYCTGACDVAAFDCDDPGTGDADLTCLQTNQGADVCALSCESNADCPTGMLCVPLGPDGSFAACF